MSRVFFPSGLATCALLASACSEGTQLAHRNQALADEAVWITTDRQAVTAMERRLGNVAARELATASRDHRDNRVRVVNASDSMALQIASGALPALSEMAHEELHRCGGFMLHDSEAEALEALEAHANANTQVQARIAYTIDNEATVNALLPTLQEASVRKTIEDMSAFKTRFHTSATGTEASVWLRDLWKTYAAARSDIRVELIDHQKTPQPSVSMTIPGALYPEEIVVIGGHLDSTVGGRDAEALAPGADDNASGIATLSEIARVAILLNYRPDRSVVFYGYAAEEIGLVGSGEIATRAKLDGRNVVGVMQVDMTNFTQSSTPYIALINDNTDPTLNAFSAELIERYVGVPWKFQTCGYACSDHASWTRNGFLATYPHEATMDEGNRNIHTVRDTLALGEGNANHAMHFVKFGVAFMAELAKGKVVPPPECSPTLPCPVGKACEDSKCVVTPTPPPSSGCDSATPCARGFVCEGDQCVAESTPGDEPGTGTAPPTPTTDAGSDSGLAEENDPEVGTPRERPGVITGGCAVGATANPMSALWLLALVVMLTRRQRLRPAAAMGKPSEGSYRRRYARRRN